MPTCAYPSRALFDEILAPGDAGSKRLPRAIDSPASTAPPCAHCNVGYRPAFGSGGTVLAVTDAA